MERLIKDWSIVAGEAVTVEQIGAAWYGFCSELGALRLFFHFNACVRNERTKAGWSDNMKTWYFRIETC